MLRLLCIGWLLFIINSCAMANDLPTIKRFDVEKYMGTWYEIAKLPNRFEKGLTSITAEYSLKPDGTIRVVNSGYKIENLDLKSSAEGKAWMPNNKEPGRLKVQFFWPFSGKYWIIYLDDSYQNVVVGSPSRRYLWFLSKSPQMSDTLYRQFLDIAHKNHFDIDKIEKTNQEKYIK